MLIIQNQAVTSRYHHNLIHSYIELRYIKYLQEKNKWSDTTVQVIAYKWLLLGINQINWTVITTKIYNWLLPTAINLKKWNWKFHDSCTLCKQKETMEHLIECSDPSQNGWRIKYVSKLQWKLDSANIDDALTMYHCTIITNWVDTKMVLEENFPTKHSRSIYSQYTIGWDNFFCGKISQERLLLYDGFRKNRDDTQYYSAQYIWDANIV